jgi:type IV pilus assembly protein PilB
MNISFDRRIRSLLERSGRLKSEQLDQIAEIAAREKAPLAQIITEKNLLTEREFAGLLAREANLPPLDLDLVEIDPQAAECLERSVAEMNVVLPISKIGTFLTIAVANPFDVPLIDHLKVQTGCDLRPVVVACAALKRAILHQYRHDEQ